jgi:hypothetical protein
MGRVILFLFLLLDEVGDQLLLAFRQQLLLLALLLDLLDLLLVVLHKISRIKYQYFNQISMIPSG